MDPHRFTDFWGPTTAGPFQNDGEFCCPADSWKYTPDQNVHPGRLTWNIIMEVWQMIFLFNWVIFWFHVSLPGCMIIELLAEIIFFKVFVTE